VGGAARLGVLAEEHAVTNAYDEIAYAAGPFPQTHPDRLAAQAALFGLAPAPAERCRVLEIGAGDGSNLIPMAVGRPHAEFVGFDLAADPVARGCELSRALGLENLRLFQADIAGVDLGQAPFDFIIAQGIYSWVPDEVREAMMRLVGRLLAPRGVAFVSFNALPGSYVRLALRQELLFATREAAGRTARVEAARRRLEAWPAPSNVAGAFQRAVAEEAVRLRQRPFYALAHDELSDAFHALFLTDFAAHAAAHGLSVLADAEPAEFETWFAPSADAAFDAVAQAQAADFAQGRHFRQILLVRSAAPISRRRSADAIARLHAASLMRRAGPGRFEAPGGAGVEVTDPTIEAILEHLAAIWPSTAPVSALVEDEPRRLALLGLYGLKALDLLAAPAELALGDRPTASPLARLQARSGATRLTTLRHTMVDVDDEFSRGFVASLDGSRTRAEIARDVAGRFNLTPEAAMAPLGVLLDVLARAPLLIA